MVEIGEKVEIILERDLLEDVKGFSMVQDFTDTGELVVSLPVYGGKPILLQRQAIIKVFFYKEEGCYSFDGQVIERFKRENAELVSISQTSSIRRIQRREFYRLKIVLPVKFIVLDDESEEEAPIIEGCCTDISGSGLRLNTDHKLDIGDMIECNFQLDNENDIKIIGKVVRFGIADKLTYKYDLGISFPKIFEGVRDTIIKFIFEKQRELRKKGFI